jgi:hypothetical protein
MEGSILIETRRTAELYPTSELYEILINTEILRSYCLKFHLISRNGKFCGFHEGTPGNSRNLSINFRWIY